MRFATKAALTGIGTVAALGLGGAPALASPGHSQDVSAVTHTMNHPDTTSVSGPCTGTSPNGPVWAYDNLSLRFEVSPETAPGDYSVTITAHGSFREIADPTTGACATGHGSVDGWIQYDVSSTTSPDPANLPAQSQADESQGQLLDQLFGGHATIVGGGHYSYSYNRVDGARYTQTG